MKGVVKYRIYCITEGLSVYKIVEEDEDVNLVCFNDPGHEINQDSLLEVDRLVKNEVIISEENIKTQGNLRCKGYKFTIPQNSTENFNVNFNQDINLSSVVFDCKEENLNHSVSAYCDPFVQGSLSQDAAYGSNVLHVNSISFLLANLGYIIVARRSSDNFEQNLGEIIEINKINGTITVENSLSTNFVTGDLLYFRVYGILDVCLGVQGRHLLGSDKIGSSFIDKRNTIKVVYTNTSNNDVSFNFMIEYLY